MARTAHWKCFAWLSISFALTPRTPIYKKKRNPRALVWLLDRDVVTFWDAECNLLQSAAAAADDDDDDDDDVD